MPSLTAADMASRSMRKGWVQRTEKEDHQEAAEEAREAAAKVTGRGAQNLRQMNAPMKKAEKRRSPLYDEPEED